MLRINEGNYQLYRSWFERSLDLILPPQLRSLGDPMKEVARHEATSKANGIKSVRAGITDLVAMTKGFPPERISAIDQAFESDGLPSLTALRRLLSKEVRNILRKGISNDDEYYTLKALQDGPVDDSTMVTIEKLIEDYEAG